MRLRGGVLLLPELLDLEILLVKPVHPIEYGAFSTSDYPKTHVESCTMR